MRRNEPPRVEKIPIQTDMQQNNVYVHTIEIDMTVSQYKFNSDLVWR